MNTKHIRQFLFGAIFSLLVMPTMGFSHEVADPLHSTPVETLDSRLAYPAEIHVQAIGQRLEIKGILKRKAGHKTQSLRGHVDVEVIDSAGKVLDSKKVTISRRPGSARHDHDRDFSAVLAIPESEQYSVRVSHALSRHDH